LILKQLVFLVLSFISLNAVEYNKSQNGLTEPFFGYKSIRKDKKNKKDKVIIPKDIDKFTADEIAKLIETSKKTAISFPTNGNIHNYIQLQNYATKRSENFAIKWQQAILKDSSLDLGASASKSTFARNANVAHRTKERKKFWKRNINNVGIVVFLDSSEKEVNTAQNKVLYFLNKDYPELVIKTLYINEHSNLAKKHKVGITPDIFLIYKDNKENANWFRVKAGLTTKNEILDNIDFVYKYLIKKVENK